MMPPPALLRVLLPLALAALAGCATPGPLHVYSVPGDTGKLNVADLGGTAPAEVPAFLESEDTLTGFAYDPFTDHFFLRLAPGNVIRVVDRPARAIKREFTIDALPAAGGGDLAIRPRDGHVFFLHADRPAVTETTRLGKALRTFSIADAGARAVGLACDVVAQRLLVLHADGREISRHDFDGKRDGAAIRLERAVAPSLAVDGERRELFAPLAAPARAIGVFDFNGRLLRQIEVPAAQFVDVGPRSFVRVF